MHQLVRKDATSLDCLRGELPVPEDHVLADREGAGMDESCGPRSLIVCVHPDASEVVAEQPFHVSADALRQRLSCSRDDLVHRARRAVMPARPKSIV
jgi:hypothetical protein